MAKEEDNKKVKKKSLKTKLRIMTMAPIFIMGILVAILSYYVSFESVKKEVRRNLSNIADSVALHYNMSYDGDYSAEKITESTYRFYKGETDLDETEQGLLKYKEETGVDVTLFFYDIRMLSTLRGDSGQNIRYTIANKNVSDAVINNSTEQFYDNMIINNEKYFAVYSPLFNSDGKCVGMIGVCKPTSQIEKESLGSLFWIPIVTIVVMLIGGWISIIPAKALVNAINKEKKFLDEISRGNLNATIDKDIIERDDELGDMGRFSRGVQKFLREMIERDTLTHLYTRRIGQSKINYVQAQLNSAGVKYCVCMGDIDFFKKFNDNYGHDCGDLVLRGVASVTNELMLGKGFAVRWGGEEFLIIFEDADLDKAYKLLSILRQRILDYVVNYNGEELKITMTFGLVEGDMRNIDDIVKEADEMLYISKQNGRNRIVTPREMEEIQEDPELATIREK